MSRKARFRVPFEHQHGKWIQTLFKSEQRHLYQIYWSLPRKLSLRTSLLVICKILKMFVNRFTANEEYFLLDRGTLTQPTETQLSKKQKTFSQFFSEFLKYN